MSNTKNYLDEWYSIKTLGDYFAVLNKVPSYYGLGEALWKHNKGKTDYLTRGFDLVSTIDLQESFTPVKQEFKNWEYHLPGYLPRGETNDFSNKFSYGFDRYSVSLNQNNLYAKLMELGFYVNYGFVVGLHIQKPGDIKSIHYDHYTTIYLNMDKETPFDVNDRQPIHRGLKLKSLFIFLDDQIPGQGICYLDEKEETQCLNWVKGDIYTFNWKTTPHWTFNSSYQDRPMLLVTGFNDGTI